MWITVIGPLANPTEIVINEAKQIGTAGNIKLNPGNIQTGLAPQMSNSWINKIIDNMINHSDPSIQNIGNAIFNNKNLITKTVTAVDKSTGEIVILKLSNY